MASAPSKKKGKCRACSKKPCQCQPTGSKESAPTGEASSSSVSPKFTIHCQCKKCESASCKSASKSETSSLCCRCKRSPSTPQSPSKEPQLTVSEIEQALDSANEALVDNQFVILDESYLNAINNRMKEFVDRSAGQRAEVTPKQSKLFSVRKRNTHT